MLDSDDTTNVVLTTALLTTVLLDTNVGVSTAILVDMPLDIGSEVAIGLLLTVNGSPHVDVGAADGEARLGMGASVEAAAGAETSTVNGSPQVLVCAVETPRRDKSTVVLNGDCFILLFNTSWRVRM